MEDILTKNLYIMKNLRSVKQEIDNYIILENLLNNFDRDRAIYELDRILTLYVKQIKEISKHKTKVKIYEHDEEIYEEKTEDDLIGDIIYTMNCLIIIASVKCGLEKDIKSMCQKL